MDFLPIAATVVSIAPVVLGIVAILLGAGLGVRSLILYMISELLWRTEITASMRPVREPRLSPDKVYEIHRAYIEHEDNLVTQRTTLMVTIQGLLLAAFGFGLQKFYEKVDTKLSCDFRDQLLHPIDTIQQVLPNLFPPENFQDLVVLEFPGIAGGGKIKNRKRGISFVSWIPGFFVWLWILMLTPACVKTHADRLN